MVAVFAGIGAGVERGSGSLLGGAGQLGAALLGRGGEGVTVNAVTGNLVIARRDEFLSGLGPDASVSRTYNSLVDTDDRDNGDQWQQSTTRRIFGLVGAENSAGSTIDRLGADGSVITYAYATRGGVSAYWSDAGAGTHDRIEWSGSQWTWHDGDSRAEEIYELSAGSASEYRIASLSNEVGESLSYLYLAGTDKLEQVTTASGEWLKYSWSGDNISKIETGYLDLGNGSSSETLTRTYYGYDGSNRLISVTTDLTPGDNAIGDGATYVTSYTYDGTSDRVATISQEGNVLLAIAYDGSGWVSQFVEHVDGVETRTTSLAYHGTYSEVTHPDGTVTRLDYDADGRLLQITQAPADTSRPAQITQFEYDADGNVIRSIETEGSAPASSNAYGPNLIDLSGWPADGSSAPSGDLTVAGWWNHAQYVAEGQWTTTTGPDGNQVVTMHTGQLDGDIFGGGNHTHMNTVDPTKAYEFTYYAKLDQLGQHRFRFGTAHTNAIWKGDADTNGLYFIDEDFFTAAEGFQTDKWYKIVGYVLPQGTAADPNGDYGGVYDADTGAKIRSVDHLRWSSASNAYFNSVRSAFFSWHSASVQGLYNHFYKPGVRTVETSAILTGNDNLNGSGGSSGSSVVYDENGRITAFEYDAFGNVTKTTDANGNITERSYDSANRVVLEQWTGSDEGVADIVRTTHYIYGDDGQLAYMVDPEGRVSHYQYGELAGSSSSSNAYGPNLIDLSGWPADGSSAPSGDLTVAGWHNAAAIVDDGQWTTTTGPDGNQVVSMHAGQLTTDIHGGGNASHQLLIETDKAYEFTYYVKFDQLGQHQLRFGTWPVPAVVEAGSDDRLAYFIDEEYLGAADGFQTDKWYKIVGYILPYSNSFDPATELGGVYDVDTGAKIRSVNHMRWASGYGPTYGALKNYFQVRRDQNNQGLYTHFYKPGVRTVETSAILTGNDNLNGSSGSGGAQGSSLLASVTRFAEHAYSAGSTPVSLAQMDAWLAGIADRSSAQVQHMHYDARGNIIREESFSAATVDGEGDGAGASSQSHYTYDQAGRLVSRHGDGETAETYVYDGLGRMVSTINQAGGTSTIVFDDAATTTTITNSNGFLTVQTYNRAGELINQTTSGSFEYDHPLELDYQYDAMGRLRMATDEGGDRTYYLYDTIGRQTGMVSEDGHLTEYVFDDADRLIASVNYASAVSTAGLDTLSVLETIADVRPAAAPGDLWSWTIYDDAGRVIQTIDGTGSVTELTYDKAGNLVQTIAYATQVDVSSFAATPPLSAVTVAADAAKDSVQRNFYDRSGRLVGTLDGEGYLTRSIYDEAGQLVQTTAYAGQAASNLWASGSLAQLLASVGTSGSRSAHSVYDGQGLLRYQVDELGHVTGLAYDSAGRLIASTQYAATISVTDFTFDAVDQAVTSGPGDRTSTTTYDSAGRISTVTDTAGLVTSYSYDSESNVRSVTRDDGTEQRTSWNFYSAGGKLRFTVDPEGYVTQFNYNAEAQLVRERRFDTAISVDAQTTISQVHSTDKGAAVHSDYAYDNQGRLATQSRETEAGAIFEQLAYSYGANGLLTDTIAGTGSETSTTHSAYDAAGRLLTTTGAWGETGTQLNGALGEQAQQSLIYDALGRVTKAIDGEGGETDTLYDRRGQLVQVTDAAGGVTSYEYNAFGEVVKVTDARGHSSYSYYDDLGRVTHARDAQDYVTETSYTAFGEVASVTRYHNQASGTPSTGTLPNVVADANEDAVTSFVYDDAGRVTSTSDAEQFVESYAYNAFGERISMTAKSETGNNAHGSDNITTYAYDKRGLLISETLPIQSFTHDGSAQSGLITNTYSYDARGNRVSMTEASGLAEERTTTYVYDEADRLIQTMGQAREVYDQSDHLIDSASFVPTETIAYDTRGNVTRTEDASGAVTVFFYDDLDRKVVEINAAGTYSAYQYDDNGNVAQIRIYENVVSVPADGGTQEQAPSAPSGAARETVFEYDALNRMTKSSVVLASGYKTGTFVSGQGWSNDTTTTLDTHYEYDANGNVVKTTDPMGHETFAYYDRLGRKTAQVDAEGYLTKWDYDSEGNVTEEFQFTNKVGTQDGLNPAVTTSHQALITSAGYNSHDRVTEYTYDEVGNRLTETRRHVTIYDGAGSTTSAYATVSYTYNGLGQVIEKTEAKGNLPTEKDQSFYTYDDGGRLISESRTAYTGHTGASVTPQVDYYYDALGNLTRSRAAGAAGIAERVTTYEYNTGGLLAKMTDAEGNAHLYFYDKSGRQLVDQYTRTDTSGAVHTEAALSSYDSLGRVIEQTVARLTGGVWSSDTDGDGNAATTDGTITQTEYNAFGDVTRSGINGVWIAENKYDLAGRMWASNAGDGIWKFFGYDKNGNQTAAITSAGADLSSLAGGSQFDFASFANDQAVSRSDVNATYTLYDARNLATQVREEGRQLYDGWAEDLDTYRSYNAFGEVASETDAAGATLTYTYNTMGRLIRSESPTVSITNEDGSSQWVKPSEDYYYDKSGRLVAQRDANGTYATGGTQTNNGGTSKAANTGNLTEFELLSGTGYAGSQAIITKQISPDGGITLSAFDIHGNARSTQVLVDIDTSNNNTPIWRTTTQAYDNLGRVIQVTQQSTLVQNFAYDELGQRTEEWNSVQGSGNKQTTTYDKHGRTIETRVYGGDVTQTSFAWDATIQAVGPNSSNLTAAGGWVQTISTEADRASTTDSIDASVVKTDIFGRAAGRTAGNGEVYTFEYDYAGRVTLEESVLYVQAGVRKRNQFEYFNTGLLKTHILGNNEIVDTTWRNKTATYGYDVLGRLTSEKLDERRGDATSPWDFTDLEAAHTEWLNRESQSPPFPPTGGGGSGPPPDDGSGGGGGLGEGGMWYDIYFEHYTLNELKDILINNELGSPPITDPLLLNGRPIISFQFLDEFAPTELTVIYTETSTILQDGHATYDALGRMTNYYDDATSGAHNVDKDWAYDANGNVRNINTVYRTMSITGTLQTNTATQDLWYAYDTANRMVVSGGIQSGSSIAAGSDGTLLSYNKAGERMTAKTGISPQESYSYDSAGRLTTVVISGVTRGSTSYDLLGRVLGHHEYAADSTLTHERYDIVYDSYGQVLSEKSKTKTDDNRWHFVHVANYYSSDGTGSDPANITGTGSSGSSTGSLLYHSETKNWDRQYSSGTPVYGGTEDDNQPDSYTTYTYRWSDGPQQYQINVQNEYGQANTFHSYDYNDQLIRAGTGGGYNPHSKHYDNTISGLVLQRTESAVAQPNDRPALRAYYFGDQRMGEVSNNGTSNIGYAASVNDRIASQTDDPGPYRGGDTSGTLHADFGLAYNAINGSTHQEGAGSYVARGGESLQQVASALWGNGNLWYKLAQANGLSAGTTLRAGQSLRVPTGVQANQHNAGTVAPYNPAESIGDTQPGAPLPPKAEAGNKCGTFGIILLAVVAVAVAALVGPAVIGAAAGTGTGVSAGVAAATLKTATGLTAALGGITASAGSLAAIGAGVIGGAIAGAASSIVSQAVGVATGIQQKFSWKSVGLAALSGGIGGGIGASGAFGSIDKAGGFSPGSLGIKSGVVDAGVRGVASSALSQGIATATGLQSSFSWAGVAAAGLASSVGYQVGGRLPGLSGKNADLSSGNIARHTVTGAARLFSSAATRSAIEGSSFGKALEAGLPDVIGQVVGGVISGAINSKIESISLTQENRRVLESLGVPKDRIPEILERIGATSPAELAQIARAGGGPTNDEILQLLADTVNKWDAEIAIGARGVDRTDFDKFKRRVGLHLVAADSYKPDDAEHILLDGYRRISEADLARWGLSASLLSDPDSGFAATIYSDPTGGSIVAFRGTEPTDLGDLISDIDQHFGYEAAQYEFLSDNITEIVTNLSALMGSRITLTGHSLGGGLATLAGVLTGLPTYTVAPAPLHKNTLARYGITDQMVAESDVRYSAVLGEPLQALGRDWSDRNDDSPWLRYSPVIAARKNLFFIGEKDFAYPAMLEEDGVVSPELITAFDPLTSHSVVHNGLSAFYTDAVALGLGTSPFVWDWSIYTE